MRNSPITVPNMRAYIGIDDEPQIIVEWDGWVSKRRLKDIMWNMEIIDFCNISLCTGHPIVADIMCDETLSARIEGYFGKDFLGYYLDYIATSIPTGRKCLLRSKPVKSDLLRLILTRRNYEV